MDRQNHGGIMLIDVLFFGFPLVMGVCLGALAIRDQETRFWRPSFCFMAYCAFYLFGGREVLLYLIVCLMMGGGWASCGGEAAPGL
jgi:hypothetical protein